jgi:hypothetical protein
MRILNKILWSEIHHDLTKTILSKICKMCCIFLEISQTLMRTINSRCSDILKKTDYINLNIWYLYLTAIGHILFGVMANKIYYH